MGDILPSHSLPLSLFSSLLPSCFFSLALSTSPSILQPLQVIPLSLLCCSASFFHSPPPPPPPPSLILFVCCHSLFLLVFTSLCPLLQMRFSARPLPHTLIQTHINTVRHTHKTHNGPSLHPCLALWPCAPVDTPAPQIQYVEGKGREHSSALHSLDLQSLALYCYKSLTEGS